MGFCKGRGADKKRLMHLESSKHKSMQTITGISPSVWVFTVFAQRHMCTLCVCVFVCVNIC